MGPVFIRKLYPQFPAFAVEVLELVAAGEDIDDAIVSCIEDLPVIPAGNIHLAMSQHPRAMLNGARKKIQSNISKSRLQINNILATTTAEVEVQQPPLPPRPRNGPQPPAPPPIVVEHKVMRNKRATPQGKQCTYNHCNTISYMRTLLVIIFWVKKFPKFTMNFQHV